MEPPFKKLRDIGKGSWNQFWKGCIKKGRGIFFSADAIRRMKVTGLSPPQMPVPKMGAMGMIREGGTQDCD